MQSQSRRMRDGRGGHNLEESSDLEAVISQQPRQPPSYEDSANHHTGELLSGPSVQVTF